MRLLRWIGRAVWLSLAVACGGRGPTPDGSLDRGGTALDREADALVGRITLEDQVARIPELAAAGADRPVAVLADSGWDASGLALSRLRRAIASLWPDRADSAARMVVSVYTPRAIRRDDRIWRGREAFLGAMLPSVTDGRTCVVSISNRVQWLDARGTRLSRNLADVLAPCLYLARFGSPGPAMADWLARTDYLAIAVAPPLSDHATLRRLLRSRWDDGLVAAAVQGLPSWGRAVAASAVLSSRLSVPPYYAGPWAVRCLAGRTPSCERALERRDPGFDRVPGAEPDGLDLPGVVAVRSRFGWFENPLDGNRWFAALLRHGTEEQFAAFWRGSGTLADAYRAAYGEPLGGSLASWARQEWTADDTRPPVRLGAPIDARAVGSLIGWGLLLAALPLAAAAGRDIGG